MRAPWPWEGAVQDIFVGLLEASNWAVLRTANTASKERGIDVVAVKAGRRLHAEVKGFPSRGYQDPARAGEKKRTSPSSQARSWFARGIFAALVSHSADANVESLLVVPAEPRYRDLYDSVATSLQSAGVHVVLLTEHDGVESPTWFP